MTEKLHNLIKGKEFTIIASVITLVTATLLGYNAYYSIKLNKEKFAQLQKEHE